MTRRTEMSEMRLVLSHIDVRNAITSHAAAMLAKVGIDMSPEVGLVLVSVETDDEGYASALIATETIPF